MSDEHLTFDDTPKPLGKNEFVRDFKPGTEQEEKLKRMRAEIEEQELAAKKEAESMNGDAEFNAVCEAFYRTGHVSRPPPVSFQTLWGKWGTSYAVYDYIRACMNERALWDEARKRRIYIRYDPDTNRYDSVIYSEPVATGQCVHATLAYDKHSEREALIAGMWTVLSAPAEATADKAEDSQPN